MRPYDSLWSFECGSSVISVAATPNCSSICASTVGKQLYLLTASGQPIWPTPYELDYEAWAVAISDDGQLIAVGTANKNPADGTLYVLSRDKQLVWSQRIRSPIWSVGFSSEGSDLVASTWGSNQLYIYHRHKGSYVASKPVKLPGAHGVYGAKLTSDGAMCLAAAYDAGLYLVDREGRIVGKCTTPEGFYNVAVARDAKVACVGTRSGVFWSVALTQQMIPEISKSISERPICGVALSGNGKLVASGSFDGRLIMSNASGDVLWQAHGKGEVWSTAMSDDASLVITGCGDHVVRAYKNLSSVSAYEEVLALERVAERAGPNISRSVAQTTVDIYARYGLFDYGRRRIQELQESQADPLLLREQLERLLTLATTTDDAQAESHFHLASLLYDEKHYRVAVRHYQHAARHSALRSSSQRKAAECFTELRLDTAATSAWRQSRELHLDEDARTILFMLARSYEDGGAWGEAARLYEMVLAWDIDYRNSWERLRHAQGFQHTRGVSEGNVSNHLPDMAVSLLGPDGPKNIDPKLAPIVRARSQEVLIRPDDRHRVYQVVDDLLRDGVFSRGINQDVGVLDYDTQLFLKYDFGLPEDEMKKFLETVNAFPFFEKQHELSSHPSSLDIGCATGRYPNLLHRLNFRAVGLDIEEQSIAYCLKRTKGEGHPKFICGDARKLHEVLPSASFNLVTCMMGTFDHIPFDDHQELINQIFAILAPQGVALISLWDTECSHLAYLSIYDETQKERIRLNSRSRSQMIEMFVSAGFHNVEVVSFCLLPQTAIYDLGIERMKASDINIAAQADLASRALFKERHGEMFLISGYKPPGEAQSEM